MKRSVFCNGFHTYDLREVHVVVRIEPDKGNEVAVELRAKDIGGTATVVTINDAPIAEILMAGVNYGLNDLNRSVWRAWIAGGVDLALVSATDPLSS